MPRYKHIIVSEPGQELDYTTTTTGRGEFRTPPRDRRGHARSLISNINQAVEEANRQAEETRHVIQGLSLEIICEQGYKLKNKLPRRKRTGYYVGIHS